MKKIFIILFFIFSAIISFAQYPNGTQFLGTDSNVVQARGGFKARLIPYVYADTTAANLDRIRQYPFSEIATSSDGKKWYRNATADTWIQYTSGAPINIYNSNGILTSDRLLTGNNGAASLTFDSLSGFEVRSYVGVQNSHLALSPFSALLSYVGSASTSSLTISDDTISIGTGGNDITVSSDSIRIGILGSSSDTTKRLVSISPIANGGLTYSPFFSQRFALEDNRFTGNRATNMQNHRLNLDSGEVVVRGSFNTLSDSVFMVKKGLVPILRVDNVVGKVNVLEFGAYNNSFFVNGATAALGNAYPFLFFDNAYISPYQQALRIQKSYPLSNLFNLEKAGVIISNDTLNAKNSDSVDYYPFIVKFRSFVDNSERTRFLINNQGSIYSARFNHNTSIDSVATIKNGFLTYSTPAEILSAAGGGSLTNFSFTDGNGFVGSVVNPTTTPALQLSTSVGNNQVVVASGGALTGSNTFTKTSATLYGYATNDVNFEAESGSDLSGLQVNPTHILLYGPETTTNTITSTLQIRRLTGGTAAAGIGAAIDFNTEDNGGTAIRANRIQSSFTSTVAGSTTSRFSVLGRNLGTEQEVLGIAGTGAVKLNGAYGINTFAGTSAYNLAVDASGNMITTANSGSSSFTFQDSLQWIYSTAYGLVGDGVTDNITGMRAMRQAAASTGRPIHFAPGVYYASDSVTFYNMVVVGHKATIKSTSNTVTIFNLADSCDVSGFKFIGNGAAASLPGGVFTLQDGIRIFGSKNRVHDNWFTSMNGSGVNIWAGACCGYRNVVNDNTFISNTIGIFAMTNSEYLDAYGNKGEFNYVGIYDRSSSNNRWWGNEFSYSIHSNFRLLGNGDHGGAWNNTFNHGNVYNTLIESCTLNYAYIGNINYTGNIGFGTIDTVHNFNWDGGTVSGATITGSKVEDVVMQNFTEGSTANTYSTTGVIYKNVLNNTAIPDVVGGALAGSFVTIKSTMGAGTTTGVAVNMIGGTNGATTLWQVANNGNIGSGFAATSGFKQIIKSLGTGSGTVHSLFRNASDQALIQVSDLGDCRIGNQSVTTSVNNFYNKNFIGGAAATTPTSWATFSAGTTSVAPINLLTGTSLTSPAAGSIEYTTPQLFFTNGGAIRQELFQGQQSRVSTQFDKTDATLANITGLTANVAAGKVYRFEAILYTTSDIAGGVKVAMAGTATATNIIYEGMTTDAGLTTQSRATALATAVGAVTTVTAAYIKVTGTITVNAAGTLTVQFAENAATATSSVLVGSTFQVIEML